MPIAQPAACRAALPLPSLPLPSLQPPDLRQGTTAGVERTLLVQHAMRTAHMVVAVRLTDTAAALMDTASRQTDARTDARTLPRPRQLPPPQRQPDLPLLRLLASLFSASPPPLALLAALLLPTEPAEPSSATPSVATGHREAAAVCTDTVATPPLTAVKVARMDHATKLLLYLPLLPARRLLPPSPEAS
jgi:hypothetical protein